MVATAKSQVLPGKFMDLSKGLVYFELGGPENGQIIILIHGFSVPCYSWDHTFDSLIKSGFRVLRFDIYGRGYSDKPIIKYNKTLYDHLLLEVLATLDIDSKVDIIGHSMGGAISVVFANSHPELVRRVCLISPAGMTMTQPLALNILKLRGVGEVIMRLLGDQLLASGLKLDLCNPNQFPEYFKNYLRQLKYPGFKYSLLSTLRSGFLFHLEKEYKEFGEKNIDTLLIWGEKDSVIPYSQHEKIIGLVPNLRFVGVDNVGHASHYEFPERINPILVDFLRCI